MTTALEFHDDARGFLAAAGDHLASDPVLNTVVATWAEREATDGQETAPGMPHWYVVARAGDGSVAGVAMRTAPFSPHPLFVLPMPEEAALRLARGLHARGERVEGVNGALPAARVVAGETARLTGRRCRVGQHTRLFELRAVRAGRPVAGVVRPATRAEADLVVDWFGAFHREADEQAGRRPDTDGGHGEASGLDRDQALRRIDGGRIFLREVDGEPVHLTGVNAPAFGATRIGPVFTPRGHRRRGYAGATVAQLSQGVLDGGARPCLFTDQANPVSNAVYLAIGYEPVVDMANLLVGDPPPGP